MTDDRCSILAQNAHLPLQGSATFRPLQIFFEWPKPWKSPLLASSDLPTDLGLLVKDAAQQRKVLSLLAFCDPHKEPDLRHLRVVVARLKQSEGFPSYEFLEDFVSKDMLTQYLRSIVFSNEVEYKKTFSKKEIFICTHAAHDRCCGDFGPQLVSKILVDPKLKEFGIFECSHLGGHRFAPTMIELPTFNCYGFLNEEVVRKILLDSEDHTSLVQSHYRGFCGLETGEQVLEAAAFAKFGREWLADRSGKFFVEDGALCFTVQSKNMDPLIWRLQEGPTLFARQSCKDLESKLQKTFSAVLT